MFYTCAAGGIITRQFTLVDDPVHVNIRIPHPCNYDFWSLVILPHCRGQYTSKFFECLFGILICLGLDLSQCCTLTVLL
ncbi:hypothetical protein RIF29_40177 [Crotalaria pallida]|uniref:Uncharacterized protein n=1 Tax=Crotalaria pallida TaxID=3830 RepID=A0AAN9E532_CROPI